MILHCPRCDGDHSHFCVPVGHRYSRYQLIEFSTTEKEKDDRTPGDFLVICTCGAKFTGRTDEAFAGWQKHADEQP
jgi:hypothetical protein